MIMMPLINDLLHSRQGPEVALNMYDLTQLHLHTLEAGTATHSSILAWRILWTEEPGEVESLGEENPMDRGVHGVTVSHTRLKQFSTNTYNVHSSSADELPLVQCTDHAQIRHGVLSHSPSNIIKYYKLEHTGKVEKTKKVEEGGVARVKDDLHHHTNAPDFRRDADKHKMSHKAFSQKEENHAAYREM